MLDIRHPPSNLPTFSVPFLLHHEDDHRAFQDQVGRADPIFGRYDAAGKLIPARMELVRLAIPRRVYTQSHIDYVIEAIIEVFHNREKLPGYRITEEPPVLRHFTAKFEPIG